MTSSTPGQAQGHGTCRSIWTDGSHDRLARIAVGVGSLEWVMVSSKRRDAAMCFPARLRVGKCKPQRACAAFPGVLAGPLARLSCTQTLHFWLISNSLDVQSRSDARRLAGEQCKHCRALRRPGPCPWCTLQVQ